jgi:hypothetical protein
MEYLKPNRTIKKIFIHCSDSDVPLHDNLETIRKWHVEENKWSDIGYHYFITKDGKIHNARPINIIPASQRGHNAESISICLSGKKHFKEDQFKSLRDLCRYIQDAYDDLIPIFGHRDVDKRKRCPNFEVKDKLKLDENNFLIINKGISNMNKFWKKTLSVVAPTIATAIGGPLAGTAVKQLSKKLLGKDNATEDELAYAISTATPDQLSKIKEIEVDFKVEMEKLGVDLAKIEANDRNSARNREINLKDKTPAILGGFIMLGFFGLLGTLLFYTIPAENEAVINIMLGALGAMATGVATYYFGSSAGSRLKDYNNK